MAERIKTISAKTAEDCLYKSYKYLGNHKNAELIKYSHDKLRGTHRILFKESN